MASLALAREEQDGLAVLVLEPLQCPVRPIGYVQFTLRGRMGIETGADLGDCAVDFLLWRLADHQACNAMEVLVGKHAFLRKHQLVDRVVRDPVPVDQLFQNISVGAERQNLADDANREQVFTSHAAMFRNPVEVPCGQRTKPAVRLFPSNVSTHTSNAPDSGFPAAIRWLLLFFIGAGHGQLTRRRQRLPGHAMRMHASASQIPARCSGPQGFMPSTEAQRVPALTAAFTARRGGQRPTQCRCADPGRLVSFHASRTVAARHVPRNAGSNFGGKPPFRLGQTHPA